MIKTAYSALIQHAHSVLKATTCKTIAAFTVQNNASRAILPTIAANALLTTIHRMEFVLNVEMLARCAPMELFVQLASRDTTFRNPHAVCANHCAHTAPIVQSASTALLTTTC